MTINVVVAQKKQIRISTNATSTAITTNNPVTLKGNPTLTSIGGGASSLSELTDVDLSHEVDGSTLVYDEETGKYVAKALENIDGGLF